MSDQRNDKAAATRDGNGRYAESLETAQRDAEATRLKKRGLSYREIAAELGCDVSTAYRGVQRTLQATREGAAEDAADIRAMELERLEDMRALVMEVLDREHVTVSNGRIIRRQIGWERDDAGEIQTDGEGKPIGIYEDLPDDAVILNAVDRLLRISESIRRLTGTDAEKKINLSGGVTYEVVGVDVADLS